MEKFETLAKMKKKYSFCSGRDGKEKIIYNLQELENFFTSDQLPDVIEEVYRTSGNSNIENSAFGSLYDYKDGKKLYYDIDFRCINVFNSKTSKRLYTYKEVIGVIVTAYNLNMYGHVPPHSHPCASITYGTLSDGKLKNHMIEEVEI